MFDVTNYIFIKKTFWLKFYFATIFSVRLQFYTVVVINVRNRNFLPDPRIRKSELRTGFGVYPNIFAAFFILDIFSYACTL
jgi:hypothetical protein